MSIYYYGSSDSIQYPSTGASSTITLDNAPDVFGWTPATDSGTATLKIQSHPTERRIIASVTGRGGQVISNNEGWLSIDVPKDGSLSYFLSSLNGVSGVADVFSFFELSGSLHDSLQLADYSLNNGRSMTAMYGISGTRAYTVPNIVDGTVTLTMTGYIAPVQLTVTCNGDLFNTGLIAGDHSYDAALAALGLSLTDVDPASFTLVAEVSAGANSFIEVYCPFNDSSFYMEGEFAPNLNGLKQMYPEVATSLTLNPSESAVMFDPYYREMEARYVDRAREGEFGFDVRRRLRNAGYNI